MALDAIHVRSRSRSPRDDGWQRLTADRRSSSPSAHHRDRPEPRRPGLGSLTTNVRHGQDDQGWHSLRTGESLAASALRMRHRFVRATHLSDPSLQPTDQSGSSSATQAIPSTGSQAEISKAMRPSVEQLEASAPTLAQLYSQLTQGMQAEAEASSSLASQLSSSGPSHAHAEDMERAHRHRHRLEIRQRSEWFISKALTKMRHSQHTSSTSASISAVHCVQANKVGNEDDQRRPASTSKRQRCPRCGDTLPLNATAEDMARHRQSIGHRLGLNAPVSSASASEAPSPAASEAPTPALNSRSSSPTAVSPLDASSQGPRRRSEKLPRRLSNAPRWKKIARDNLGHSLLSRMGWKEGMGLGVQEWKWQQNRKEKVKRQQSAAVRALIQRRGLAAQEDDTPGTEPSLVQTEAQQAMGVEGASNPEQEPEWMLYLMQQNSAASTEPSSLQATFPFQFDTQSIEAARTWLLNLTGSDAEWHQCLSDVEQQILEQALLSGRITLQDVQAALWNSTQEQYAQADAASAATEMEAVDDSEPSNALLYPVQVELRIDRSGIGRQRRRSRDDEGSVEIRRPSPSTTGTPKKARVTESGSSPHRPRKSRGRSRSHSSSGGGGRPPAKKTDATRRQRELAYQKDKQEWLDLRASLS